MQRLIFGFCALALSACGSGTGNAGTDGGGTDQTDAATTTATLEVGTGMEAFEAFADGDTLDLVPGCQGLQHVWVALRVRGIDPSGTIINLSLVRDRDQVVVSQVFHVRVSLMSVPGQPYHEVVGLTLVVPEPDEALGEDLTLRASVTEKESSGGRVLSAERHFRVEWATEGGCLGG
jgi:hypothetical protein